MAVFFIADTHFNDKATFYMSRESEIFESVHEKDDYMIKNWNTFVKPEDEVFILGDFGDAEYMVKINGKKTVIKGNHDSNEFADIDYPILFNNFFILSHEPIFIPDNKSSFANIFGHIHNNPMYKTVSPRSFCVCACRIDYTPICFEEILKRMKMEEDNETGIN